MTKAKVSRITKGLYQVDTTDGNRFDVELLGTGEWAVYNAEQRELGRYATRIIAVNAFRY